MNKPIINLNHGDCMEAMKSIPDNYYDLAIVDPPYGIGAGSKKFINKKTTNKNAEIYYKDNCWDIKPSKEYFNALKRVSKNYIVWGGNYFIDSLEPSRCFIVWNKKTGANSYADCELALTSFDKNAKIFDKFWLGANAKNGLYRIHPTEKPIELYEWLLINYAKEGDKILDTHGGSMSIAIACHNLGYDLDLWELDKDYFEAGKKRFIQHVGQLRMF